MKAGFITLGCKVNIYESNALKEALESKGFEVTEAEEEPLSNNNKFESGMKKDGRLNEDFAMNKEKTNQKARENFSVGQKILLKEYSEGVFPEKDGSGYERAYNFVDTFDPAKMKWNSDSIEKTTTKDAPRYLWTKKQREEWVEEHPYKLVGNAEEGSTLGSVMKMSNHFTDLMGQGKISKTALMDAMATSSEMQNTFLEASINGNYSKDEIAKLNSIMDKIYIELTKGITVNQTE